MKTVWAPWRMQYILSPKKKECIFCTAASAPQDNDRANLVLYRDKLTFVMMNKYPYSNGHLMVLPYRHASGLDSLPDETLGEMMKTTSYAVDCLKAAFRPEGFNVGINLGKVAGAGIEEHLHIHIVPRWAGDASFITVIGEVRVIPEHVLETYDKLLPAFNRK